MFKAICRADFNFGATAMRTQRGFNFILPAFAVAALLLPIGGAGGQTFAGCTSTNQASDGNLVLHCRQVIIEVERGADVKLTGRNRDGEPAAAALSAGAIYIEDNSKASRGRLQVTTPDAIASVRGTTWVVDVTPQQSSVFVVAGNVDVRRRQNSQQVSLSAGDGVDVAPGDAPLVVKRWPAERVRALLARFGR
jgi:FecR protein